MRTAVGHALLTLYDFNDCIYGFICPFLFSFTIGNTASLFWLFKQQLALQSLNSLMLLLFFNRLDTF